MRIQQRAVYGILQFLAQSWLLGTEITVEASPVDNQNGEHSSNDRIRLHDGWRFQRFETIPDQVVYDRRGDANGTDLHVLKPWILPTANDFIADPTQRHEAPSEQPQVDIEYVKASFDDSEWADVTVPHDWAIALDFLENDDIIPLSMGQLPVYGVGWYRRTLEISLEDLDKMVFLDIDGAMSYPMVWVNEQLVGGWPFGYASFRLDITSYLKEGENTLAVRVDNPSGSFSRWYPGAGIYRNVWLTKVNPTHIGHWGTFITSRDVSAHEATLDLVVNLENQGNQAQNVTIITQVYEVDARTNRPGRRVAEFPRSHTALPANNQKEEVTGSVKIRNPRLWGPPPTQSPHIYVAVTQLRNGDSLLDTYETRFGIRSLTFDPNRGILVNGEHLRIQGVNQHHDLGALGAAYNERAAERQLELLQELGVNAIRMAHNPPAPELLDLTDRMGFLVFDESLDCWAEAKTDYDYHLLYPDWHEADIRAFIRRDRNHPSVFLWSYGNEVPEQNDDDEKAAQMSLALAQIVHEEDPTRLRTFSLNTAYPNSSLAATADVISLNYQGEGIRYGPAYAYLTEGNHRPPMYDYFHEALPDKVIMGSEVAWSLSHRGSFVFPVTPYNSAPVNETSGGDPSTWAISAYELYSSQAGSSADRVFWTQDQEGHEFVAGGFVWSGWDYIGEPYWCETCRSADAGIIDLAGFKKERFWLYQARWRPDYPMAHIIPHWNWKGEREGKVTPVHVFSSGDEAELFINGVSQGRLQKGFQEYRFRWDNVTYVPGEVKVVTYKNGKKWATDRVRTTGEAKAVRVVADRSRIASDGEDLSFLTAEIVDKNGLVVPEADNTVRFSVSGAGRLVATDNGYPADFTAFTSDKRKVFKGLCLGIVSGQAGRSGTITVTVESEGLAPAEIELVAH